MDNLWNLFEPTVITWEVGTGKRYGTRSGCAVAILRYPRSCRIHPGPPSKFGPAANSSRRFTHGKYIMTTLGWTGLGLCLAHSARLTELRKIDAENSNSRARASGELADRPSFINSRQQTGGYCNCLLAIDPVIGMLEWATNQVPSEIV